MTLLSVQSLNIALTSGRKLVEEVSFTIEPGEMLALVGESGSGKSLTALSIMQLLGKQFHTSGSIRFNGGEMNGASDVYMRTLRGRRISMIFQEPMTALNPLHPIGKQIREMLQNCGERNRNEGSHAVGKDPVPLSASQKIEILLDQVGLSHLKDRLDAYPHQLSGGERQRVMIAIAIANRPDLLIADEPTTAVDVTVQAKILELLKKLQHELKMSMLFITHDLTLVEKLADRVAVMKEGRLVEIGKVAKVFAAPKHSYTQKLLGSKPSGSALPLPTNAATILDAKEVSVQFAIRRGVFRRTVGHTVAVNNISFDLKAGETIGIVGESGSGKTTLAFALLRMLNAVTNGKVTFLGNDITGWQGQQLRQLRKNMQLVFQDPFSSLNPRMTVGQIVGEGLHVHTPSATGEEELHTRIFDALTSVGLTPDMAERYPHEFSGGQRQRISIARAMILKPKLVILDEPTSALDLTVQAQIISLLKQFQEQWGLSYIFISHDLRVIRAIAHRIMVLRRGEIVEAGVTESLFMSPASDYTRELLHSAYLL